MNPLGPNSCCKELPLKRLYYKDGTVVKSVRPTFGTTPEIAYAYLREYEYEILTPEECKKVQIGYHEINSDWTSVLSRDSTGKYFEINMEHFFNILEIPHDHDIEFSVILIRKKVFVTTADTRAKTVA